MEKPTFSQGVFTRSAERAARSRASEIRRARGLRVRICRAPIGHFEPAWPWQLLVTVRTDFDAHEIHTLRDDGSWHVSHPAV